MADTKGEAPQVSVEQSSPPKKSVASRICLNFKKWWWIWLFVVVCLVLVVVLPVVCVGYPKIARHDVKKSTLNITSMVLSDPKPDSFALNQSQTLNTDSHFHPWIFGFNANVSLAGAPRPFTSVHVPKVKSKDGAVIEIVQRVNASDMDSFADFAKTVLTREEFEMIIQGKTKLKQGGLQNVSIDYNKTVKMKGLNNLKGFNVTEFQILQKPENGRNLKGAVSIPNPSVMTLTLGNVTFDLLSMNQPMGQAYLDDVVLKPGENTLPLTATVDAIAIFNAFLASNNTSQGGVMPFIISGNSSVYNGQHLPYFTEALRANNFTVHLNVSQALQSLDIRI